MKVSYKLERASPSKLHIEYTDIDFKKSIYFEIPHDFFISTDSLVALAIACRPKKIESISFDFPISSTASSVLTTDYKISLNETETTGSGIEFIGFPNPNKKKPRKGKVLNFSGGVDSLGANYICAGHADLISIDFGERFAREKNFFKEWDTRIVCTNLRDKPFNENVDWRFMSAGAILLSDYIGLDTIFFGTILEASPWWFKYQNRNSFENSSDYQVFRLAKLRISYPVVALSEYGTTLLASKYGRDVLEKSIESAADKGTSKYFRKVLLQKIVLNDEITSEWAEQNKPKELKDSGSSFAEDILAMYFAHKLGFDFVDKYILKTDDDFKNAKSEIDMSFFEKYNQNNMASIPSNLQQEFVKRMENAGIFKYEECDIENINKLRSYLAPRYNFSF
jgi:hypothetical protein